MLKLLGITFWSTLYQEELELVDCFFEVLYKISFFGGQQNWTFCVIGQIGQ